MPKPLGSDSTMYRCLNQRDPFLERIRSPIVVDTQAFVGIGTRLAAVPVEPRIAPGCRHAGQGNVEFFDDESRAGGEIFFFGRALMGDTSMVQIRVREMGSLA
jgi:hypothetical protein